MQSRDNLQPNIMGSHQKKLKHNLKNAAIEMFLVQQCKMLHHQRVVFGVLFTYAFIYFDMVCGYFVYLSIEQSKLMDLFVYYKQYSLGQFA